MQPAVVAVSPCVGGTAVVVVVAMVVVREEMAAEALAAAEKRAWSVASPRPPATSAAYCKQSAP